GAHAADLVHLTDLQLAQRNLAELGSQHTLHSVRNIVDGVVDDAVHTHFHLGGGSFFLGDVVGTDVEADDDGVGSVSQIHVGLADGADADVDNPHPDLLVGQHLQRLLDGLGRALYVGLDHDGQLLHVILGHLGEQIIQS